MVLPSVPPPVCTALRGIHGVVAPARRSNHRHAIARAIVVTLVATQLACGGTSDPTADAVDPASRRWMEIYQDANYTVFVDRGNITKRRMDFDDSYDVWYRTVHRQARLRRGEEWSVEFTNSVVRCEKRWYKVVRVDLTRDGYEVVSHQVTDFWDQPWREVDPGSVEELTLRRACSMAQMFARQEP